MKEPFVASEKENVMHINTMQMREKNPDGAYPQVGTLHQRSIYSLLYLNY
jgi:hypothetical protein